MTAAMNIRLHILEESTNGFSANSIIGRGGFGDVYKGVLPDGEVIAVKLLHNDPVHVLDDEKFNNEVVNLLRIEHPNIVQLRGYCYETQQEFVEHNGETRPCRRIYRVLCFEYLQNGSLDRHLHARSLAPNWSTRYNIIKGICEGLNFLHECEPPIFHLDLKPANILLDNFMVPKVADFGLSRLFNRSHTHVTNKIIGTKRYMPPEFIKEGIISNKNDVFSLGVVIREIIAGYMSPSLSSETADLTQSMHEVHTNWKIIIGATLECRSEQLHQVQTCIDTAVSCMEPERKNRPTIADILGILNKTETNIPRRQLADELPCPTVDPISTESDTLEMMIAELENIANKDKLYNSTPDIRDTTAYVEEEIIFGRTEEKQEILSTLSRSMTKEMVILPIYGIGGIGKTTLAQMVFNNTQFQECSRVWVYVSEIFDLKKIGNSIISQLANEISHIDETQIIHNRLEELFDGKSTLIVLDNLWEKDECKLDELKTMLRIGRGSKVTIVTTRDEAIAVEICDHAVPYKLETLSDDMCWKIIKQKSSFKRRVDKKPLKCIGREIATKCGGVALAAQSLGYMLRKMKQSNQWESVRDNCIWNLSTLKDPSSGLQKVLASLLLSYSHMPAWLKLCFTYCAVFPKGHHIAKYDLIHQWIALRFTEQSDMFDPIQLCEAYVEELLGMSFLQYSKTQPSSDGRQDKDVTFFTMHDLVHDLARAILAHQVNDKGNPGGNRCRYALLTNCTKPLQWSVTYPANIRALHFLDCRELELHGDAFSLATYLRVLDLSECLIQRLPDSICKLKKLRFLHAPRIQDHIIPNCITELSELNYLNLRGSYNISALPESIGYMKGLMHLDLSGCSRLQELPISFAELKQLVHLDLSHCPVSILEAFCDFTKLQYLNLSFNVSLYREHRRWLPEFIGNLHKLRHLNLSGCMGGMGPSQNQTGSLLDSISTLTNLEQLNLSDNHWLSSIPESIGDLRKLQALDLSGCSDLRKLPDSMVNMVSLKVLNVKDCGKLDASVLSLLNVASLPHFVVHASSHQCSSNIILLEPTNPRKLIIDRLENVKSAEEAQRISLIKKQNIEDLTFKWSLAAERFVHDKEVLEKLVPPNSVKYLDITGYSNVSIPDWLMDISQYLTNILEIKLCDFPKCNNLPPLSELPNLEHLSLCRMEGLEEWSTTYSKDGMNKPMFPKLEVLIIKECAKLNLNKNTWCQLKRLEFLSLSECGSMTSIMQCLGELTSLNKFEIAQCEEIKSFPDSIQELSNLQCLYIHGCPELVKWCESEENKMKLANITDIEFFPISANALGNDIAENFIETTNNVHTSMIADTVDLIDEMHSYLLYSAVMNVPGFTEEALLGALSHLMDNNAQGSTYMGMQEEERVSWVMKFLKEHY